MVYDRLTWVGFLITALGWTLLLAAPQVIELIANLTGKQGNYLNMPTIAECSILTGLGIAIVGALRTGFGVLKKFFEAVLDRTGKSRTNPSGSAGPQKKLVVERGRVKDRPYVLYLDGSVEVETMLGRRIFSSLSEAQEFIA